MKIHKDKYKVYMKKYREDNQKIICNKHREWRWRKQLGLSKNEELTEKIIEQQIKKNHLRKSTNGSSVNNNNWKGGKFKSRDNYIYVINKNHPYKHKCGYVAEHRLVMEKHLGRYLKPKEIIHHIDYDTTNNHIDNLHLFPSHREHAKYHWFLKKIILKEIDNYASSE